MASKNNPGKWDCYANALADEPMFILLARDPYAPDLVEEWAAQRQRDIESGERPDTDWPMVHEAYQCATDMQAWRDANDGKWRVPNSLAMTSTNPDPGEMRKTFMLVHWSLTFSLCFGLLVAAIAAHFWPALIMLVPLCGISGGFLFLRVSGKIT